MTQKQKINRSWGLSVWIVMAVAALTSGCMTTPGDGGRVATWTTPVDFFGFTPTNPDTITIQAFNFSTSAWETIGTTASSGVSVGSVWGATWYNWSFRIALASRFWQSAPSGATGSYARVRASDAAWGLFTSLRSIDWNTCITSHFSDASITTMAADCASHRTPESFVYTNDYEHGSAGCSAAPTTVKDHYNVTEIPACKRADIGALIKQKINHDFVLKHHDTNFIDHNLATGPHSFFRGHHAYVREMQNYLSVYGEKWAPNGRLPFWTPNTTIPSGVTDIASDPANCPSDTPGCTGWVQSPHVTLSPNLPLPSSLTAANMCSQNTTINTLLTHIQPWHDQVHTTVGGSSGTFRTFDSPAATIFWPWHKYVDDLYVQWQACGFPEP